MNKIVHGFVALLVYAIPVLISAHPGFLDLTLSTIVNAFYLCLSHLINPTVPVVAGHGLKG